METKTILIIGPQGVGKSQILENLTARTGFKEDRPQTVAVAFKSKTISSEPETKIQVWDTPGTENFRGLMRGYFNQVKPNVVLVAIDHQTLTREGGADLITQFSNQAREYAPNAEIKIVVNKVDREQGEGVGVDLEAEAEADELAIKNIKKACKKIIVEQVTFNFDFDPSRDIIYYSAKQEAEEISTGKEVKDDPIIQSVVFNNVPVDDIQLEGPSFFDRNAVWEWLEPKLIILGKVLLFLLIAAALTVVFGVIGALIGAVAGAWSGPGAFFTAIGGAFTGAVTAGNLLVLIIAPVLGVSITGIGFGLWYRNPRPPSDSSLGSEQNPDGTGPRQHRDFDVYSAKKEEILALTKNRSSRVVGNPSPPTSTTTENTNLSSEQDRDNLSKKNQ